MIFCHMNIIICFIPGLQAFVNLLAKCDQVIIINVVSCTILQFLWILQTILNWVWFIWGYTVSGPPYISVVSNWLNLCLGFLYHLRTLLFLLIPDWVWSFLHVSWLITDVSTCQHHGVSNSQRRAARTTLRPLKPSWPDSDSDTEDFLNIVSESRKAFLFTESALEQFRQHHVDGTVIHDPAEYVRVSSFHLYLLHLSTEDGRLSGWLHTEKVYAAHTRIRSWPLWY